jgi:two-component system NarL family sensor kinase
VTTHALRLLVVLVLSSIVIVFGIATFVVRVTTPTDGAYIDPSLPEFLPEGPQVTILRGEANGLRNGDLVLAVEGVPLDKWARSTISLRGTAPRWEVGQTVHYTVLRDGQHKELAITLGTYPIGEAVGRFGTIIFPGLLMFLIGSFVFARRTNDGVSQIIFLVGVAWVAAPWVTGLQVSDLVTGAGFWLYLIGTQVGTIVGLIGVAYFALMFPQTHPILDRHPRIVFVGLVGPFVAFVLYVAVASVTSATVLNWLGQIQNIGNALFGIYILAGVGAVIANYRLARSNPVALRKARWILWGSLVSGIVGGGWQMWINLLGEPPISTNVVNLVYGFIPISFAIAILRYQLFDIDVILSRTLIYLSLTAALALTYFASVILLQQVFNLVTGRLSDVAIIGSTLTIAAVFNPFRRQIQGFVDRRFYRQKYDVARTLETFGEAERDEVIQ